MHATKSNQAWTLALLNDCHSMALAHLRPHLDRLFMNSDLAFLEFAEKAQTEASQIRFMEAMSVIQKNRTHIEEVFLREIGRGFSGFDNAATGGPHRVSSHDQPLTLMSKEETDIQVAIQNMVCSASLGSNVTLSALRKRLAVLNNGRMPEDRQIPAGPHSLAEAFHQAVKDIILEHETRLVIYLLFDRFVLCKSHELYDQYNQHLVKSGILPHLRYDVKKYPAGKPARQGQQRADTHDLNTSQQAAATAGHGSNRHSLADELFNDILDLLSRHASAANGGRETASMERRPGKAGSSHIAQPPIQRTELVTEISKLQDNRKSDAAATSSTMKELRDPQNHAQLVASMMQRLSAERDQLFNGIDRRRVPGTDTRIIDLVGMMFEFMLRDKHIPSIAKAELSRLHTPYLKIAILDKGLFTDTTHPAHVLLNRLAAASARWVFEDNLERGIFPCLRSIVQHIIEEFDSNLDIFPGQLEVLETTLQNLENKASAIEERSRQAEKGKERLGMARAWAARAIEQCVAGHRVPARLRSMLSDVWMDKLTFIYLRVPDSEQSTSWRLATQVIDAIIWSTEPRTTQAELEELRNRLPDLRNQIRITLDTLGVYGNSDNHAQLTLIRELQEAAAQGTALQHEQAADDNAAQEATPDRHSMPQDKQAKDSDEAGAGKIIDTSEARLSPEEEKALSQLQHAAFGSWFIIQQDESTPPLHVKLSWYSSVSGNYMFVDSMGVRVLTRKHHELASLLAAGKARIVDREQPFMQSSMEKIRRFLGGEKTAHA